MCTPVRGYTQNQFRLGPALVLPKISPNALPLGFERRLHDGIHRTAVANKHDRLSVRRSLHIVREGVSVANCHGKSLFQYELMLIHAYWSLAPNFQGRQLLYCL